MIEHHNKMKKTNSSQVKPQNIMTKEELEEEPKQDDNVFPTLKKKSQQ